MINLPADAVSRIGGAVSVDLLNTVAWRLDPARRKDHFETYAHVLAWMHQVEWLSDDDAERLAELATTEPAKSEKELSRITALRDDAYAALVEGGDAATLERSIAEAHANSSLEREVDGRWTWSPRELDLSTPRFRLALSLADLVTSNEAILLSRCEDEYCGWVFLDTSRQHNRRWCSSADCGNRNRVRAHYERRRRSDQGAGDE